MNASAAAARSDVLLFLHADTRLPPPADVQVLQALATGACRGRFDVRIEGWRWEQHGVWRTIVPMWRLRWRYRRGESPARLPEA